MVSVQGSLTKSSAKGNKCISSGLWEGDLNPVQERPLQKSLPGHIPWLPSSRLEWWALIGYPSTMASSFTPLLNFIPTQLRSYTSVRWIHVPQTVHSISWTPLTGSSFLLSWPVEAPSKSVQNAFSQVPGGIRVMNALGMSLSIFWTSGWQHCLPQFQLSSLQEAPKSTWGVCWAFILIKTC